MGQPKSACRGVAVCLLFGLVSCADKTPAPQRPQAAAPLTTPVPTGIPAGPPVQLMAATVARPFLLGTISISSVDRLLSNGTKLVSQAMPLPMDAVGLRDMILSQAGLPPEVSVNLDFASPCAAAFVALEGKGKTGAVLAVPARGPAEAQKIIDALGKKLSTRGAATLVEGNTGGRGWLYLSGNIVVLSDDVDALARGTMLTLEARRPATDDVSAVMFPDAVARANGTDVKTAIDRFLKDMQMKQATAAPAASGGDTAAQENTIRAVGEALALAGDASSIEAGLVSDPARGLTVHARFNVRPGTRLETVAKEMKPFQIDPAVATTSPGGRFIVGANSLGPFWRGMLATYRDRLAADKKKGAASAGKVATALAALDAAAASALLRAQLGDTSSIEWTVKKESVGKIKTQHFRVKLKKGSETPSELSKHMLGQTLDLYWAVADTRMLLTLGKDAKTRLTAIAAGKAATETNKALAEAQAGASARDLFYYLDLTPILAVVGALAEEQRLSALAKGGGSPIPMIFTAGGDGAGKLWTMDMTLPVAAFTGIGGLVAAGMGGN
jgi:hypothetical protein